MPSYVRFESAGLVEHWNGGILEYWNIGQLEEWNWDIGILEWEIHDFTIPLFQPVPSFQHSIISSITPSC